ncbi:hypothetical protein LSAT2_022482 [Lamellibrachia satsuma]|nr:hypothetical protein LSAT2_022482 [Lamellibrachia satsuma]
MTPSIVRLGAHRIVERQCRFAVSLTANSCANRDILEGRAKQHKPILSTIMEATGNIVRTDMRNANIAMITVRPLQLEATVLSTKYYRGVSKHYRCVVIGGRVPSQPTACPAMAPGGLTTSLRDATYTKQTRRGQRATHSYVRWTGARDPRNVWLVPPSFLRCRSN